MRGYEIQKIEFRRRPKITLETGQQFLSDSFRVTSRPIAFARTQCEQEFPGAETLVPRHHLKKHSTRLVAFVAPWCSQLMQPCLQFADLVARADQLDKHSFPFAS